VRILESIQWKYLRILQIRLKPGGTLETSVMRALVDGAKKTPGRIALEHFELLSATKGPLTLPPGDLQQDFFAPTLPRFIQLQVDMTLQQILSFIMSIDVSILGGLRLRAVGFDSGYYN